MARAAFDFFTYLQSFPLDQVRRETFELLNRRAYGAGLEANRNSFQEIFTRVVQAGAKYGLETLDVPLQKRPTVASAMTFTMTNPRVSEFIARYTFSLITGIASETRAGIQTILASAVMTGLSPAEQARLIQPMIGLLPSQAQAVINYRRALEDGQLRNALNRASRDGRYDRSLLAAIRDKKPLRQAQIENMVDAYVRRSLRSRAEMIARSETIRAANAGLRESWRQAQEQGLLLAGTRQKWIIATDERTCPTCSPVPSMNEGGVLLGTYFLTPVGLSDSPPLHPRCRCTLGLVL